VFSFCGVFFYRLSLFLQSGDSDVFRNPCAGVTAHLADVRLTTGTGDLVPIRQIFESGVVCFGVSEAG
jgi:hypothetical protein